ncbi:hypothetical protein DYS74_01915 [Sinirhodobacter hankyongi]|uniref:Uncharacterized protein n=2 Tax=Paenirhodobacter hankyongi TaxID=2294033 RepID=A0A421BXR4_9RHOB|nr:hypothetical protein DYS74_01915 [Sinirhodobacter hankyongi]
MWASGLQKIPRNPLHHHPKEQIADEFFNGIPPIAVSRPRPPKLPSKWARRDALTALFGRSCPTLKGTRQWLAMWERFAIFMLRTVGARTSQTSG